MADNKPAAPATAPAAPAFDYSTATVQESPALPVAHRATKANPMEAHVTAAVDKGARFIDVPNSDEAKRADRFIRSAANKLGYGSKVRYVRTGSKYGPNGVQVHFQVTTERAKRNTL